MSFMDRLAEFMAETLPGSWLASELFWQASAILIFYAALHFIDRKLRPRGPSRTRIRLLAGNSLRQNSPQEYSLPESKEKAA